MPNTINQWRDGQWRDGQLRDWQSPAHLAALEAVDPQTHRGAMRHFASPVTVVTSRKDDDPVGLTATAVCSASPAFPAICAHYGKAALPRPAPRLIYLSTVSCGKSARWLQHLVGWMAWCSPQALANTMPRHAQRSRLAAAGWDCI